MKFGIRDGCLGLPWESVFKSAAELGFDGGELDIGPNYEHTVWWRDGGADDIRQWADEAGGRLCSACLGALWSISPASRDADIRSRARDLIIGTVSRCRDLDARFILVPITPAPDVPHEEASERWASEMRRVAPTAEDAGVYLCLENVGAGCAQSAKNLMRIVDAVASPYVKAYYDFGNGLSLGNDPAEEIRLLGIERIAVMHAKDPGGQLLGQGRLDWNAVVSAVNEIGFDGWIILETPATNDPPAAARHNLEFLKSRWPSR
ncbi:MAG: sugar phosphate isomerase/epimerase family protein [Armatimonadota bacterium]